MGRKAEKKSPEIGANIKELRKQKGMTQEQLAKEFDVTVQTVRNWESGRRTINLNTLQEICKRFDCDISDLLGINQIIEDAVDSEWDEVIEKNRLFVEYLESIGFSVDITPMTTNPGIDAEHNKITPHTSFRYEVQGSGLPKSFNEKEWVELQARIAEMIKLLVN